MIDAEFMGKIFVGLGVLLWFRGTIPMLSAQSNLRKLHWLSVSDTLGSMLIIAGLLFKIPVEWPLLVLSFLALAMWNTLLGYVISHCAEEDERA